MSDAEWRAVARALALSTRERQIVRRLFGDRSEADIADDLGISPHTVHTHLERLYQKLAVGSRCAVIVRVFAAFRALQADGKLVVSSPARSSVAKPTAHRVRDR